MASESWTLVLESGSTSRYSEPTFTLGIQQAGSPYLVMVEVQVAEDDSPSVVGVTARRTDDERVSARDIQRLPLSKMMRVATAAVSSATRAGRRFPAEVAPFLDSLAEGNDWQHRARDILVPRGQPQRGNSANFYLEIAQAYREFEAIGEAPVPAIAKRKRKPANTVHQWVHRARKLGFLDPSPRRISHD